MIKKLNIKKMTLFVGAVFVSIVMLFGAQTSLVSAQKSLVCDGLSPDTTGGSCAPSVNEPSVDSVLETSLNIMSFIAGTIAVIMIVIAGAKFITSQGDAGKVASARTSVLYAIIGIVVVVFAQAIVMFAVDRTINPPQPIVEPVCAPGQPC